MKRIFLILIMMSAGIVFIAGCGKKETNVQTNPKQETNKTISGTPLAIDTKASSVKWLGKKVTGQHHGTINIMGGEIYVDGNKITGGVFDIDMTSIIIEDLTDTASNKKLSTHLKSDDFFSVAKYPVSKFEITKVENVNDTGNPNVNAKVTGNLTIKEITKSITFPANIKIEGKSLTANAELKIDRTEWNVKYGSGKFFENLGDKMIDDIFTLNIELKTKPIN